jgi:hypothetical protein
MRSAAKDLRLLFNDVGKEFSAMRRVTRRKSDERTGVVDRRIDGNGVCIMRTNERE